VKISFYLTLLVLISCNPLIPYQQQSRSQILSNQQASSNQQISSNELSNNPNLIGRNVTPGNGAIATERNNELPYELIPDFISALTCTQRVSNINPPYTLSISSFFEGLRLSDEFKRTFNFREDEPDRIRQALTQSSFLNATAEFSVRTKGSIETTVSLNSNPINSLFPNFNTSYIQELLINKGKALSTRPSSNRSRYNSSPFRSRFRIDNLLFVRDIAPHLSAGSIGNYLLTMLYTFPQSRNVKPISTPIYDFEGKPYGKSYTIDFNSNLNIDYLYNIQEENLRGSDRVGKRWICPEDLRFIVHKNKSERDSFFNREATERYSKTVPLDKVGKEGYCDITNRQILKDQQEDFLSLEFGDRWPFEVGELVLRESGRLKNSGTPCIVFPANSCYPSGFYRIEFDSQKLSDCKRIYHQSSFDNDFRDSNSSFYRVCPAFLSMCYRRK